MSIHEHGDGNGNGGQQWAKKICKLAVGENGFTCCTVCFIIIIIVITLIGGASASIFHLLKKED